MDAVFHERKWIFKYCFKVLLNSIVSKTSGKFKFITWTVSQIWGIKNQENEKLFENNWKLTSLFTGDNIFWYSKRDNINWYGFIFTILFKLLFKHRKNKFNVARWSFVTRIHIHGFQALFVVCMNELTIYQYFNNLDSYEYLEHFYICQVIDLKRYSLFTHIYYAVNIVALILTFNQHIRWYKTSQIYV